MDKMNIEALVIAETFGSNVPANDNKIWRRKFWRWRCQRRVLIIVYHILYHDMVFDQ